MEDVRVVDLRGREFEAGKPLVEIPPDQVPGNDAQSGQQLGVQDAGGPLVLGVGGVEGATNTRADCDPTLLCAAQSPQEDIASEASKDELPQNPEMGGPGSLASLDFTEPVEEAGADSSHPWTEDTTADAPQDGMPLSVTPTITKSSEENLLDAYPMLPIHIEGDFWDALAHDGGQDSSALAPEYPEVFIHPMLLADRPVCVVPQPRLSLDMPLLKRFSSLWRMRTYRSRHRSRIVCPMMKTSGTTYTTRVSCPRTDTALQAPPQIPRFALR